MLLTRGLLEQHTYRQGQARVVLAGAGLIGLNVLVCVTVLGYATITSWVVPLASPAAACASSQPDSLAHDSSRPDPAHHLSSRTRSGGAVREPAAYAGPLPVCPGCPQEGSPCGDRRPRKTDGYQGLHRAGLWGPCLLA